MSDAPLDWDDRQDVDLLDVRDVMKLPNPEWLIAGLLPFPATTVLYGPSRHGKSFIALSQAAAVADGHDWHGHKVKRMPVLYVAGEGGRGIKKRLQALMIDWRLKDIPGLYVRLKPLDVHNDEEIADLEETLEAFDINIGLVVIDTLATAFGGRDENTVADMQNFVGNLTRMSNARGLSCLIVHHSGRQGGHERGSTALKAGVDAQFKCEADLDAKNHIQRITLSNDKQKDWEEAEPVYLVPRAVGSSLVLDLDEKGSGSPKAPATPWESARASLEVFREFAHDDVLDAGAWRTLCSEKGITNGSHYRHRKTLQDHSIIVVDRGTCTLMKSDV